jgi:PAS domain S-box-containing protein
MEGKTLFELYPGYAEEYWRDDKEVIASGSPRTHIIEPLETSKGTRWVETDKLPYRDSKGNVVGIIGFSVDITERKRAEGKLLALHSHAQQLASARTVDEVIKHTLDAMEFTLGFSSADFSLVDEERRCLIMKGKRGEKPCSFSKLPLDGHGVTVKVANTGKTIRLSDTRKEDAYVDDEGHVGKDASPAKLSELAVPVMMDDKVVAVLNVESTRLNAFTDEDQTLLETLSAHVSSVLNRLKQDEALRKTEQRFHDLFDHIPSGVYISTHGGRFVDVNPAFVKMFGYSSRQDMLDIADIKKELYFSPDERGSHVLDTGKEEVETYRMRRRDGSEIWVEDHGHYVHDERGNVVYHEGILRDVTERKRAEETVRASELKYRTLFEKIPHAIYRTNAEGKLLMANPAFVRLLGYESEGKLLAIQLDRDLYVNGEDRSRWMKLLEAQGEFRDAELRLRRKDGREIIVLDNAHAVRGDQGALLYYEGTLTDITARRRAELSLSESEEKYRAIVENSTNMISIVQDGMMKYVNKATCERLGWTFEEMTSPSFNFMEKIVPQQYRKRIAESTARRLRGEKIPPYEQTTLTRDGLEIPVEIRAERINYLGKQADAVTVIDISERKRAEDTIRQRAQELNSLQETLLEITGEHDLPQLLNRIVERAAQLLNAPGGGLYLCDADKREARCVVSYNTKANGVGVVLKYGEGAAGVVAQTGKPLIINDYRTWPSRAAFYEKDQPFGAVLSAPMVWQSRVIGVIHILRYDLKPFTEADLELLTLFANHATIAVQNAKLIDVAKQRAIQLEVTVQELNSLQETLLEITNQHHLPELLDRIVERSVRLLHAEGGGLDLCDPIKREVRCVVSYNTPHDFKGLVLKYGEGSSGRVAETGKPLIIDDYREWEGSHKVPGAIDLGAVLSVPMIWQGQVTGVIQVIKKAQARHFTQSDLDMMALFANHAAIAVENARLLAKVEQHADQLESKVEERTRNLAASEARYRRLFDSSPISLWEEDFSEVKKELDDLRGRGVKDFGRHFTENPEDLVKCASMVKVLDANEATLRLYGAKSVDEIRGALLRVLTSESHARFREELVALGDGKTRFATEFDNQTLNGEIKHVSLVLSVIPGYENTLAKVLVAVVDLTERKEMEERLQQAERMAAVGETAAMVGHDLRNPLQGIAGAAYVLKQESLPKEEREGMLRLIEDSVEYSDRIVRELLEYSAKIKLDLADTTLKSIIGDALQAVRVPGNITVQNLSEEPVLIRVDRDKMKRVLINLIENAIDAMPQGGTLRISAKQSDGAAEIALSDSGSGIPGTVVEKLWKPFQTTKARGLGLGLAICKRFVDSHGGNVSAESTAGEGTTITIRLPLNQDPAPSVW